MSVLIKKTTKAEQQVALSSMSSITKSEAQVLQDKIKVVNLKIQDSNDVITIPLKALLFLKSIIENMAQGKSITLIPSDSEISTQQAAEILKVSRPYVVKLLESGKIPFRKIGSHRRIQLKDVLEYNSMLKTERRKNLDFLANEAQELNMGYE
ncbi:MAG: helix-turn-helix domain-containing protein [Chitinophagales bacterium]